MRSGPISVTDAFPVRFLGLYKSPGQYVFDPLPYGHWMFVPKGWMIGPDHKLQPTDPVQQQRLAATTTTNEAIHNSAERAELSWYNNPHQHTDILTGETYLQAADEGWSVATRCPASNLPCAQVAGPQYKRSVDGYTKALDAGIEPARFGEMRGRIETACNFLANTMYSNISGQYWQRADGSTAPVCVGPDVLAAALTAARKQAPITQRIAQQNAADSDKAATEYLKVLIYTPYH